MVRLPVTVYQTIHIKLSYVRIVHIKLSYVRTFMVVVDVNNLKKGKEASEVTE